MNKEAYISLPEDYLLELGRIVYCWSKLEDAMDMCLSNLLDISYYAPRSGILFANMGFKAKLDILSSLFAQLLPSNPSLETYPSVISQLGEAQRLRNRVMHDSWGIDGKTGEVKKARINAHSKLKASLDAVPLSDLVETREKIFNASYSLFSLFLQDKEQPNSDDPQRGQ